MTLTGIFKNILLVVASVLIWRTTITPLQFIGYGTALAGLVYYSLGYDQLLKLYHQAGDWLSNSSRSSSSNGGAPPRSKRWVVVAGAIVIFSTVFGALAAYHGHDAIRSHMEKLPQWFGSA